MLRYFTALKSFELCFFGSKAARRIIYRSLPSVQAGALARLSVTGAWRVQPVMDRS
jgi:hypothetical protein